MISDCSFKNITNAITKLLTFKLVSDNYKSIINCVNSKQ